MGVITNVILPLALALIMFAMGLGLTGRDFARVFAQPKDFLAGAGLQLVVLPAVAFLLASVWPMAAIMAVGLMILPATAARYWCSTITGQLILGFAFALASCWVGLTLSYVFPETPSGPAIVLVAGAFFLASLIFAPLGFGRRLRKLQTGKGLPALSTTTSPERRT